MRTGDVRKKLTSALDLGQAQDFTAWVITERSSTLVADHPRKWEHETSVRHIERFPPGTAYAEIFGTLRERYIHQPLNNTTLVVDQTGVGKPVMDLLSHTKIPCSRRKVSITTATTDGADGVGGWLIPKKDLVGLLQVMLQNRKIKIAESLDYASVLMEELQHFQMKTSLVSDTADISWRERPHDDLVLALALACWQAERDWLQDEWLDHRSVPMVVGTNWRTVEW